MDVRAAPALVLVLVLACCPAAGAQIRGDQSADRWVTIAARVCDDYADITANLARDDAMESLQDLGPDSLYEPAEPIDPRTEADGQPACRALVGWRFTLGDGFVSRGATGPWGALSIVTNPDNDQPDTKESVPARDFDGQPVGGGVKIPGAVTVGLNRDQADRANRQALWLQGGAPDDPVLSNDPQFAAGYGFGALRCAVDNLKGDNVEGIEFPTGTRHMYCYAYYVDAAPSSGTIVVRKEVQGARQPETFRYVGNLSYETGGVFDLSATTGEPGEIAFARGETGPREAPWTVTEAPRVGWTLTGLSCASRAGESGTQVSGRTATIRLAAGDTVTCTFANRRDPLAGALVLRKVTPDAAGRFRFTIRDEHGHVVAQPVLTTRRPDSVGAARKLDLGPGRYAITEQRPVSREGVWVLSEIRCNNRLLPPGDPVVVTVTADSGVACTFTNTLHRPGRISIAGVSLGGVGTAVYTTTTAADDDFRRVQFARTTQERVPAPAKGQSTDELPFRSYTIMQAGAHPDPTDDWALVAVSCNGRLLPFEQGRVRVRVSVAAPVQRCTFVNRRLDAEPPVEPTEPPPGTDTGAPGPDPAPGGGVPDLRITKRLARSGNGATPNLTFLSRVRNRSETAATDVVVADRLPAGTALISAHPSRGSCQTRGASLLICRLGDLAPGASARIRVRLQHFGARGGVNTAVVGAGSPERVLRDNIARARFPAVRGRTPGACPATAGPHAHAAC